MATERPHFSEISPFGQKVLDIILEDQARVARRRRTSGIYSGDRPVIQFGVEYSTVTMVSYFGRKLGDTTVEESRRQQFVFESRIWQELLARVVPGEMATVEGTGWYNHSKRRFAPEWDKKERVSPKNSYDYHAPVRLSVRLGLSRDSKLVLVELGAEPLGIRIKTDPINNQTMMFDAHLLPDFRGIFQERMSQVPQ